MRFEIRHEIKNRIRFSVNSLKVSNILCRQVKAVDIEISHSAEDCFSVF